MILNVFLSNYVHFNGVKLSGDLKEFTICKNHLFEENKRFEWCIFVLSNSSTGEYKLV